MKLLSPNLILTHNEWFLLNFYKKYYYFKNNREEGDD